MAYTTLHCISVTAELFYDAVTRSLERNRNISLWPCRCVMHRYSYMFAFYRRYYGLAGLKSRVIFCKYEEFKVWHISQQKSWFIKTAQ